MTNPFSKYKGKAVVLIHPECPHCRSLKERLASGGKAPEDVVFLDLTKDEEARALAEAFDVRAVPAVFFVSEEDGKTKVCKLDEKMEKVEKCMEVEHEQ
jgi:thiol-disulfide isomerase/thioredoxin